MGAGNSAVVVDLPRWGPMLSPRVPNLVPIPGPRWSAQPLVSAHDRVLGTHAPAVDDPARIAVALLVAVLASASLTVPAPADAQAARGPVTDLDVSYTPADAKTLTLNDAATATDTVTVSYSRRHGGSRARGRRGHVGSRC